MVFSRKLQKTTDHLPNHLDETNELQAKHRCHLEAEKSEQTFNIISTNNTELQSMLSIPARSRYPSAVEGLAVTPPTRKMRSTVAALLATNPLSSRHAIPAQPALGLFQKQRFFIFIFLFFIALT